MYGNLPDQWSETLSGADRLRVIVNALTRLRFCTPDGRMEFETNSGIDTAPEGFLPWFDVPGRMTNDVVIGFGHWSTLGWHNRSDILALDSGCVWGGCLSAARVSCVDGAMQTELIQVKCPQAQKPGANVTLT
jgi:bis(5'-nucleosyl)-tetraphosphatase (symmetrical)